MNVLIVMPLLIPLGTAIASIFVRRWLRLQVILGVVGAGGLMAVSLVLLHIVWRDGIQVVQMGNWPAPFGITLVVDLFSAIMLVLAGLMGLVVAIYSVVGVEARLQHTGYYTLLHILLMGVCGVFLSGDIFNMFVWFEVLLIASFVLLVQGGERAQMEGAIKYVTLNLVASTIFLAAIGILYGKTGTLNFADLAHKLSQTPESVLIHSSAVLFLVAFGIKAAAFPLFFWLPASYHTPSIAVTTIFSLLTKVGMYALIRCFTTVFTLEIDFVYNTILVLSGFTMVTGVLGAVAQNEMRRLLSFHIISQIGYILMGVGLSSAPALAAAILFTFHVTIAKAALFIVAGIVDHLRATNQLKDLGGLYLSHPGLSILFLIVAFSLAGLPPFLGFFAKFGLIKAGLIEGQFLITFTALMVSFLTLFSMVKIWNEVFWKPAPMDAGSQVLATALPKIGWVRLVPLTVLAGLSLLMGLGVEPLVVFSNQAAEQLLNQKAYIQAVLGEMP
jgi:multicomponent Na+:H+ antiporter subunit D